MEIDNEVKKIMETILINGVPLAQMDESQKQKLFVGLMVDMAKGTWSKAKQMGEQDKVLLITIKMHDMEMQGNKDASIMQIDEHETVQ